MKKVFVVFVFMLVLFPVIVYSQNFVRTNGKVEIKSMRSSGAFGMYPTHNPFPPANDNACDGFDHALTFNLYELAEKVGNNFDVNNLYFKTYSPAADDFMDNWLDS